MGQNVEHNAAEEAKCLDAVRQIMAERQSEQRPVAGMIIEPVLSEGGDLHASEDFFRNLQTICKEFGSAFIVDEVQTGVCASGYMWAHEAWDLEESPDFVCFSKKALSGGYYYKDEFQPPQGYRIFNTWMGDATKLFLFKVVLETIEKEGLQTNAIAMGEALTRILSEAACNHPRFISNIRGKGTIIAFDCQTTALRDQLAERLRNNGVLVGTNGTQSIRFRPPLTFKSAHLAEFQSVFENSLGQLSVQGAS